MYPLAETARLSIEYSTNPAVRELHRIHGGELRKGVILQQMMNDARWAQFGLVQRVPGHRESGGKIRMALTQRIDAIRLRTAKPGQCDVRTVATLRHRDIEITQRHTQFVVQRLQGRRGLYVRPVNGVVAVSPERTDTGKLQPKWSNGGG